MEASPLTSIIHSELTKLSFKKCYTIHFMTCHHKRKACAAPYRMGRYQLEMVWQWLSRYETERASLLVASDRQHCSQSNASLSFLERNLRSVTQEQREKVQFTIFRPRFEYASDIPDHYLKIDKKCLDCIQRHASHFVTNYPQRRYNHDGENIIATALL